MCCCAFAHQIDVTADPVLVDLLKELRARLPRAFGRRGRSAAGAGFLGERRGPAAPRDAVAGTLSFISTTTVFGTPMDVTLEELALETFFPADPATAAALRNAAEA